MKAVLLAMSALLLLGACGGGGKNRVERFYGGASVQFASGPIQKACVRSDRRAANGRLCGCIQSVANRQLSSADQRLAVKFFQDPHQAQEIRQSDRASHEAFWQRYKSFVARAEGICSGV
ncbi:hypothetical protein [Aestuariicoccus sp. MJ-SS9]|uniref:hypothetical protein n=1 Tax=Aestuariicoccus sp. MJ-SS9 TaxID=3079855 RepID=UPI0029092B25|nr:hypothetical protein [Aestuariicoccus sp. MJ-SS9]MDU8912784.1 hypothetical protein [Aestuariicoccus sp. MJ-SS9]